MASKKKSLRKQHRQQKPTQKKSKQIHFTPRQKKDAIVNMLVRHLADWRGLDEDIFRKNVHALIGGKESTVNDYINRLMQEGRITRATFANIRQSSFKHEFRQALSFSLPAMKGKRIATFITDLIHKANFENKSGKERNFYIIEGVVVFGADYDAMLSIVTNNGVDGIVEFEEEFLSDEQANGVTRVFTWPVSHCYRWNPPPSTNRKELEAPAILHLLDHAKRYPFIKDENTDENTT